MNAKQLKGIESQMLDEHQLNGVVVFDQSVKLYCEGKFKALFLKAKGDKPIPQKHYDQALSALEALKFKKAKDSMRVSVKQTRIGGELLLGWKKEKARREDRIRQATRDQLGQHIGLEPLFWDFECAMREHLRDYWKHHMRQAFKLVKRPGEQLKTLQKVKDPWRRQLLEMTFGRSAFYGLLFAHFSTITLNRNILFGAHEDGNNMPGTMGCLSALGDYAGGILCLPRLGVAFDLRPRDLLIADTNEEFHTNLGPIVGKRYSVVAYLHSSLDTGMVPVFDSPDGKRKIFRGFRPREIQSSTGDPERSRDKERPDRMGLPQRKEIPR
jgi:hypothetical protein